MSFDLAASVGAVVRRVEARDWEGSAARIVVAERHYAATPEEVWDAIVTPERLKRWFLPISGDLHLGGRYQLEGNAGGTIRRCDAPHRLDVTWEFGGGMGWVNLSLETVGTQATRLTLEHIAHENEAGLAFWTQFGPGAVGVGWDLTLYGLAIFLASGGEPLKEKEGDWLQTADGKAFGRASAAAWGEADAAFGTDRDAALGAAGRTSEFYTGPESGNG